MKIEELKKHIDSIDLKILNIMQESLENETNYSIKFSMEVKLNSYIKNLTKKYFPEEEVK